MSSSLGTPGSVFHAILRASVQEAGAREALARQFGVELDCLPSWVAFSSERRFWPTIEEWVGHRDIGFLAAQEVDLSVYDGIDAYVRKRGTLRDAYADLVRVSALGGAGSEPLLVTSGGTTSIEFRLPRGAKSPSAIEYLSVLCFRMVRRWLPDFALSKILYTHPLTKQQVADRRAYFSCTVATAEIGQGGGTFDTHWLDCELAPVLRFPSPRAEAHPSPYDELDRVYDRLVEHALCDLADVCRATKQTPAAYRRRLRLLDTTHRQLLDRARLRLATNLLSSGETESEVARRLGYDDPNSLRRSLVRWSAAAPRRTQSGTTPPAVARGAKRR